MCSASRQKSWEMTSRKGGRKQKPDNFIYRRTTIREMDQFMTNSKVRIGINGGVNLFYNLPDGEERSYSHYEHKTVLAIE